MVWAGSIIVYVLRSLWVFGGQFRVLVEKVGYQFLVDTGDHSNFKQLSVTMSGHRVLNEYMYGTH